MRFMAGDPEVPVLVRLGRNLLLTEAGLLVLGAIYLLLARGVSVSGLTTTVEGGIGLGTEAAIYLALAIIVAVIAVKVGRLVAWARWAALTLEVLLIARLINEVVHGRGSSSVVGFLFAIVIAGLLLSPQANRAFALAAAERAGTAAGTGGPAPSEGRPGRHGSSAAVAAPPRRADI